MDHVLNVDSKKGKNDNILWDIFASNKQQATSNKQ
jgi:hypothetical protein